MSLPDISTEHQAALVGYLLSDQNILDAVRPKMQWFYFHETIRGSVRALLNYYDATNKIPPIETLQLNVKVNNQIKNLDKDFAIRELIDFFQTKAYEYAAIKSLDFLDKKDYASIHRLIDEAALITQPEDEDLGMVYGNEIGTINPPIYLLSPWLVKNTVTAVYGAPGAFKSFFVLDAALQLATGSTELPKMSVCYIAAEGASGLNLRAEAWLHNKHETLSDKDFVLMTKPINLISDMSVTSFINQIKKIEKKLDIDYSLIVIDTLSQCMPGADENAAKDITMATSNMIRIRRELDATVIFVHHSGKDPGKEMRGSSAIKGNTDAMIEIVRDGNFFTATAHVRRQKDAPIGDEVAFALLPVEIPRLSGYALGRSLVCQTGGTTDDTSMSPMKMMAGMTLLRDVVSALGVGNEMSVHALNIKMGRTDTTFYKKPIANMTPMDKEVVVACANGVKVKLMRTCPTPTGYGIIKCYK